MVTLPPNGVALFCASRPKVCTLYTDFAAQCRRSERAKSNWKRTARIILSECQNSARKKSQEQASKDSLARQEALEQLGIKQEFNFADHAAIYRFGDHVQAAPIETINARASAFDSDEYSNGPCASDCHSALLIHSILVLEYAFPHNSLCQGIPPRRHLQKPYGNERRRRQKSSPERLLIITCYMCLPKFPSAQGRIGPSGEGS